MILKNHLCLLLALVTTFTTLAQKPKARFDYVQLKCVVPPSEPLPSGYHFYSVSIDNASETLASQGITNLNIEEVLDLPGFTKKANGGHFHIKVTTEDENNCGVVGAKVFTAEGKLIDAYKYRECEAGKSLDKLGSFRNRLCSKFAYWSQEYDLPLVLLKNEKHPNYKQFGDLISRQRAAIEQITEEEIPNSAHAELTSLMAEWQELIGSFSDSKTKSILTECALINSWSCAYALDLPTETASFFDRRLEETDTDFTVSKRIRPLTMHMLKLRDAYEVVSRHTQTQESSESGSFDEVSNIAYADMRAGLWETYQLEKKGQVKTYEGEIISRTNSVDAKFVILPFRKSLDYMIMGEKSNVRVFVQEGENYTLEPVPQTLAQDIEGLRIGEEEFLWGSIKGLSFGGLAGFFNQVFHRGPEGVILFKNYDIGANEALVSSYCLRMADEKKYIYIDGFDAESIQKALRKSCPAVADAAANGEFKSDMGSVKKLCAMVAEEKCGR